MRNGLQRGTLYNKLYGWKMHFKVSLKLENLQLEMHSWTVQNYQTTKHCTTVSPTNSRPATPPNPPNPFQTCARPQGGCSLTCPRRPNYSSCVQQCNRGKESFFLNMIFHHFSFTSYKRKNKDPMKYIMILLAIINYYL